MIGTHCHLLPRLDEGPRNLLQALALAWQLTDSGVHTVIGTPHYSRRFPTDQNIASERLAEMRSALAETRVQLELDLAAEIVFATMLEASPEEQAQRAFRSDHCLWS